MDNQQKQSTLRLPQDGQIYKGVNTIAHGCTYKVVKVNKTTCWVRLLQDGKPTNTIYKGVCFHHLGKLLVDVPQIVGYTTNEPVYASLEESDKPEQEEAATTTDHPSQDLEAHVWATLELIKGYYNLSDSESTRMAGWLTRLYNAGYNKGREGSRRHTLV